MSLENILLVALIASLIAFCISFYLSKSIRHNVDDSVKDLFLYEKNFYVYQNGGIRKYKTDSVRFEFSYFGLYVVGVWGYNPKTGREDYFSVGHGYKEKGYLVNPDLDELMKILRSEVEDFSL